uniref:Uncharacterized protein n=1 Tax=Romanomermis culicivorax TaxID=13658 RepID=A0A915JKU1_ROMCU
MDYPDALKEEIQRILLPPPTLIAPAPQMAQMAPVITQKAVQLPVTLPPPIAVQPPRVPQLPQPGTLVPLTAPVDVQTPQAPSTSAPALDRYGQPIRKPGHYEHSMKHKQHLHEEAEYRKSHKTHTTDEPRTKRMPPPSTSCAERGNICYLSHVYLDKSMYQCMETDTDSIYLTLSSNNPLDAVKPECKEEFMEKIYPKWFVKRKEDKQMPGMLKVEWQGTAMCCLAAKTYTGIGENE